MTATVSDAKAPQVPGEHRGRLQLALNVSDLEAAVERYSAILGVPPHKRRPGYANFAVDDPPLKLVLFQRARSEGDDDREEGRAAFDRLNHLGVEVPSTADVVTATRRLGAAGLETLVEEGTDCCHALQDKVWVDAPDGVRWEVYTVLDELEELEERAGLEPLAMAGVPGATAGEACCAADCCTS